MMITLTGLTVLISSLGSSSAIRRLLPVEGVVTVGGYWRLTHALLAVVVPAQVLLFWILTELADLPRTWSVLLSLMVYGVGLYYSNQSIDLVYARGLPARATSTKAAGTLVTLILVAACVATDQEVNQVVIAYAIGSVSTVLIAHARTARERRQERLGHAGEGELLKAGSRLMGMTIGQAVASRADTFILGALSSPTQVGLYSVAMSPAGILRLPAAAMGQVIMYDAAKGLVSLRELVRKMRPLMVVTLALAIVGYILADPLIPIFFGREYADAPGIFRVLIIGELAIVPFLILSRYVAAIGSAFGASFSGVVGVAVMTLGAFMLIPEQGATGAAWASVAAYASMTLSALIFSLIGASSQSAGTEA